MNSQAALGLLLGECSKQQFLREIFERGPRLFKGAVAETEVDELFGIHSVEALLSQGNLRYPQLELIAGGVSTPPPTLRSGVVDRVALLDKVRRGDSLRISSLQNVSPVIMDFARRLSRELGGNVSVNAYVTPPGVQGLKAHYDDHDVFIVQCLGDKRWAINQKYERQVDLPTPRDGVLNNEYVRFSDPASEVTFLVQRGDVLYLPRGTLHCATATDRGSIHITVGYYAFTWAQLIQLAVKIAERGGRELRMSAPVGLAHDAPRSGELAATFARLLSKLDIAKTVNAARENGTGAYPASCEGVLSEIFGRVRIDADARLILSREGYHASERDEDGAAVSLAVQGRKIRLEGADKRYFERLERSECCKPSEVAAGEDIRDCTRFLETLFHNGVVRVVASPEARHGSSQSCG